MPRENWDSPKMRKLRERWLKRATSRNRSEFADAKLLVEIKTSLPDGDFPAFCMDQITGLGVASTTQRMYDRMVAALEMIPAETIWEKIGWIGVKKLIRVEKVKERTAVTRRIAKEDSHISITALDELLKAHAPSYRRGKAKTDGGRSRAKAIKDFEQIRELMLTLIAKYPVLKSDLSAAHLKLLGIEGGQVPQTARN